MPTAGRDRREQTRRRTRLPKAAMAPTNDCLVCLDPARMRESGSQRRERARRRIRLPIVVFAPAGDGLVDLDAARMGTACGDRHEVRVSAQPHLMARPQAGVGGQRRGDAALGAGFHPQQRHVCCGYDLVLGHRRIERRDQPQRLALRRALRPGAFGDEPQRLQTRRHHHMHPIRAPLRLPEDSPDGHLDHRPVRHIDVEVRPQRKAVRAAARPRHQPAVGPAIGAGVGAYPHPARLGSHRVVEHLGMEIANAQIVPVHGQPQPAQPPLARRQAVFAGAPTAQPHPRQQRTTVRRAQRRLAERALRHVQPPVAVLAPAAKLAGDRHLRARMIRSRPHRRIRLAVPCGRGVHDAADAPDTAREVAHAREVAARRHISPTRPIEARGLTGAVGAPAAHLPRRRHRTGRQHRARMRRPRSHRHHIMTGPGREVAERHHRLAVAVVAPAHHLPRGPQPAHMTIPHRQLAELARQSVAAQRHRHRRRQRLGQLSPALRRPVAFADAAHEPARRRRRQRLERMRRHRAAHRRVAPAHHRPAAVPPTRMTLPSRHLNEPAVTRPRRQRHKRRRQPRQGALRVHDPPPVLPGRTRLHRRPRRIPLRVVIVIICPQSLIARPAPDTPTGPATQRLHTRRHMSRPLQRSPYLARRRIREPIDHVRHHPRHKRRRHRRAREFFGLQVMTAVGRWISLVAAQRLACCAGNRRTFLSAPQWCPAIIDAIVIFVVRSARDHRHG